MRIAVSWKIMLDRFRPIEHTIDRFLDGELPESEHDRLEKRCLEDEDFFARVREREALRARVAESLAENGAAVAAGRSARTAQPGGVLRRLSPFTPGSKAGWAYAGLAAVLLGLAIFLVLPQHRGAFAVNPELEGQLGVRVLRSSTLTVLSPEPVARPQGEMLFSWSTTAKGPFRVVILDHQAEEVASLATEGQSLHYQPQLAPGLYYWKLLQDDDWVYTGKIIIEQE